MPKKPPPSPADLLVDVGQAAARHRAAVADRKAAEKVFRRLRAVESNAQNDLVKAACKYVVNQPDLLAAFNKCRNFGGYTPNRRSSAASRRALAKLSKWQLVRCGASNTHFVYPGAAYILDAILAKQNEKKGLRMSTKTQTALDKARAAERKAEREAEQAQKVVDEANHQARLAWEAFFASQERTRAAQQDNALDRPGAWEFLRDLDQSGPDFSFKHPMPEETLEHLDALDVCGLLSVAWSAYGCVVRITNEGAERAKHRLRSASWVGQLFRLDWGRHRVRLGCMTATQTKQPKRRTTLLRIRCPGDLRATFDKLSKTTGKTYAALLRDMVQNHTRKAA